MESLNIFFSPWGRLSLFAIWCMDRSCTLVEWDLPLGVGKRGHSSSALKEQPEKICQA